MGAGVEMTVASVVVARASRGETGNSNFQTLPNSRALALSMICVQNLFHTRRRRSYRQLSSEFNSGACVRPASRLSSKQFMIDQIISVGGESVRWPFYGKKKIS
jgi:hypothetical protein